MAAIEVTITGMLYDKTARTSQPVVLIGEASLTGLSVGGGPMPPGQGGGQPPNWGPGGPPHPEHPIWGPPGSNFPDKPGYPPVAGHPLPEPPNKPPDPIQSPVEWKTIWTPTDGWVVVGVVKPAGEHVTPSTAPPA